MIGKIMIGKSFSGCIKYCMEDKKIKHSEIISKGNRAEVLLFNQCFGNTKELIQQFHEIRQLNTKLSRPVLHITLSLSPGEKLKKGILINMAEDCAKHFGFSNNQFVAVTHNDTHHQHMHIVANRIGFDKRTVSDSNNYRKMAAYCRGMEVKYKLQKVLSPKKFLPKELQQIPRIDARKDRIKKDVQDALLVSRTLVDFERYMKQKKYQIIKGRGISFIDEKGVYVKGSSLGYSLAKIQKILQHPELNKRAFISVERDKDHRIKKQLKPDSLLFKKSSLKDFKNGINKTSEILLNPVINNDNVPYELIKKKRLSI